MDKVGKIDALFHSVIARFFAIPARQPVSGAVTFAQMRVLWTLEVMGSAAAGEVARRLGIANPSATELVDRLVRGGYVHRAQSPEDRRQVVLTLRSKGRAMLADYAKRRRERFAKLVCVVGRKDVRRMGEALETLNEIVGKWPRRQE